MQRVVDQQSGEQQDQEEVVMAILATARRRRVDEAAAEDGKVGGRGNGKGTVDGLGTEPCAGGDEDDGGRRARVE